ncbi:hypothetical protein HMPREF2534_01343 [Bacteroides thetaiotaomicron]|nr:hypothetical protein HMPREF2534_01343 [Bacteroides thetaiotaomicron]
MLWETYTCYKGFIPVRVLHSNLFRKTSHPIFYNYSYFCRTHN